MELSVVDNPDRSRFEARTEDGAVAGVVEYTRSDGAVSLDHTEVDEAFGGMGVGSRLAGGAFRALRAEGVHVVNDCPFLERYMRRREQENAGEYDWVERVAGP